MLHENTERLLDESIESASLMIVYVNVTWYHKKYEMICIAPSSLIIVYVNVTWKHREIIGL
jgi:hypothetical protein